MKKRLAIVTTHPIQYNAPFFRLLALQENLDLLVFYTWGEEAMKKYDPGFDKIIEWDIPLLDGYPYRFVKNVAKRPGSHHFFGIDNPALIPELQGWKPSAILVYGWAFKSHLQVLRHFRKKMPLFFRGDSTLIDSEPAFKRMLKKVVLRWVYRHVDIAFYAGSQNKQYFLKHGLKENQLVFMPHAVDNDRFATAQPTAIDWLEKLGLGFKKIIFLYAGKFSENKNVELLIDAFCEVRLAGGCLLVAGNGPLEINLKDLAKSNPNICFLPFHNQTQMPGLLSAANVVVLPSKRTETWGLIINEAMACGKAVLVSSACGCAADLVQSGKNGLVFTNNDRDSLVRALRDMAENREKTCFMGEASAEIIRHWSFQNAVSALNTVLQKLK